MRNHKNKKKSVHIKAERTHLEELRYKERIQLKEKRILVDYKRTIIEKENFHIQNMVEDERIMKVNTSGSFRAQKLFFMYNSKRESLQDRLQVNNLVWHM